MYKLTVFIPHEALHTVKEALFAAGAGEYGAYDRCAWQVLGQGQFRPLAEAHPFLGTQGCDEKVAEWRVEMLVADRCLEPVVHALYAAHPYEEPAFDVVALVDTTSLRTHGMKDHA